MKVYFYDHIELERMEYYLNLEGVDYEIVFDDAENIEDSIGYFLIEEKEYQK